MLVALLAVIGNTPPVPSSEVAEATGTLSAWATFWQMSNAAFVMLVLLTLAIQAVLVIAPLKWLQLRRMSRHELAFERALEQARNVAEVWASSQAHADAPGARVMRRVVSAARLRGAGAEDLLGVARRAIVEEEGRATTLMPSLASLATVSPLLGLFGTVWGIIEAFLTIATEKSSELPLIAPAMSGALLTTALGLLAAMPATLAYNYVDAAISRLIEGLDTMAQSWAGHIAGELR